MEKKIINGVHGEVYTIGKEKECLVMVCNFPIYECRAPHDFEGFGTEILIIGEDINIEEVNEKNVEEIKERGNQIYWNSNGFGDF